MAHKILVQSGQIKLEAELNETATALAILKALPIESPVNLWGEEIYFSIPVKINLEKGQETVQKGDLAYWPPGSAFCIFFGRTPMSSRNEIRPASAVTVVGRITGDYSLLKNVKEGAAVRLTAADR